MFPQLLQGYFPTIFLIIMTYFMIYKDKSFNMKARIEFYMALLGFIVILVLNSCYEAMTFGPKSLIILEMAVIIIRPALLATLMAISVRNERRRVLLWIAIPVIVNALLCLCSINAGLFLQWDVDYNTTPGPFYLFTHVLCLLYLIAIVVVSMRNAEKSDTLEHVIVILMVVGIIISAIVGYIYQIRSFIDDIMAVSMCLYYFYMAMQVYKRDALTSLMNRHDMIYDLEEMRQKRYLISMIDIDNFKIINDKYGHEKGDDVIKLVVRTIKKNLSNKSRIYRFGGDEFAVVSKGIRKEQLEDSYKKINVELEQKNQRISVGTYEHQPGEDYRDALAKADQLMYENKRQLKSEAIWDDMTGLYNLRGFLDELELLNKQAIAEGKDINIVAIDIDHLGNINLAYGYAEGSLVITTLANIIKSSLDYREFAGHIGSDEFVVAMLVGKNDESISEKLLAKINSGIRHAQAFDNKEYTVAISFAELRVVPGGELSLDKAIDEVLYQKQGMKENRRKGSPSDTLNLGQEINKEEEALALDIIENNRLRYAFQPIVSAKDGKIVAYEALMRSNTDPQLSPLAILRHANHHQKNYEIEKLTYMNVLKQISESTNFSGDKRVFINSLPGFILTDEDYASLKEQYGTFFNRMVVEITEQSELGDEELAKIKERQNEDGYGVAIDDYGSGNSNTFSLLKIRPQIIKLDRLLISDIDTNTKKQYFVNSIITFAKENGMQVLAEGVETEGELKMVIRLQVDYIQGYYTAKPSFEMLTEIKEEIKHSIINENIRGVIEGKRKIFVASRSCELSLVQIALEEYTGITVSAPDIRLIGNTDYVADMCLKIADGLDCRLNLKDVRLNSVDDLPCIDIGEGATLTLVLEGNCTIDQKGIHVAEGSSLIVKGAGNLNVSTKGHDCYGIGCRSDEAIGNITFNQSGKVSVRVDGELCAAVGGGIYKSGRGIIFRSGEFDINVASVEAIGIGCFRGDVPISINDCTTNIELRVNIGSGIGSMYGFQNTELNNFKLQISGSGSKLSGIGTNNSSGGFITMNSGTFDVGMSGQEILLIGNRTGKLSVQSKHAKLHMKGEGDRVTAIGSMDKTSVIQLNETTVDIIVNAAHAVAFGADDASVYIAGATPVLHVNE